MYPKYEFERSRDFQKISGGLTSKGTCSIDEDCLSLRSKRVPQALQVANLFDTERLNFLQEREFSCFVLLLRQKNENEWESKYKML